MGFVNEFADWAVGSYAGGLPARLREGSGWRLLDVVGNSLAAVATEPAAIAQALGEEWGGQPQATVLGMPAKYPTATAAFINGTLAHALDFDDTHLPSIVHPSASVVPAALAAGEASHASGAQVLDAVTIGTELAVRLGMAGYDPRRGVSIFFERGFHATSICGAIGGAVAAALLRGDDTTQVAAAAGIAASMGAGILEANRTGGSVKRVHCGWAAHVAICAAAMAHHGLTGPPTVFEGRFGLVSSHCGDEAQPEVVLSELGTRWEVDNIAFKPYPCNVFTHAIIDAVIALREDGLRPDAVASIEIGGPQAALRTIAFPVEEKARPRSGYHAAFSAPYVAASAILGGGGLGLSHADFADERLLEAARMDLAAKVTCVVDDECDRLFPAQMPAVVRVVTTDGTTVERRVDASRGTPTNPLTATELMSKFRGNLASVGRERDAERIIEQTLGLQQAESIDAFLAVVGPRDG